MGLSRNSQSYVKQIVSSDILDRKYSLILKPVELNVSTGYFLFGVFRKQLLKNVFETAPFPFEIIIKPTISSI